MIQGPYAGLHRIAGLSIEAMYGGYVTTLWWSNRGWYGANMGRYLGVCVNRNLVFFM